MEGLVAEVSWDWKRGWELPGSVEGWWDHRGNKHTCDDEYAV